EDDAADRAGQIACRKSGERGHQRHDDRRAWKERVSDVLGEDAEDDEVIELERTAKTRQQHDAPAAQAESVARRRCRDAESTGGVDASADAGPRFLPLPN